MTLRFLQLTLLALCAALVAGASKEGAKAEPERPRSAPIPILMKEHKVVGTEADKNYRYIYQTGNGIFQEEQGIIKHAGEPGYETQLQQGQFQYVSPEGQVIQLRYTADENGFRPVGDHIPTPPPVPIEIQKLLAVLATKKPDPADDVYDSGDYSLPL